ncbi:MAG: WYL domain-containing protein [Gemmatimonadota bacterium]|nr:WYL domain-containing protein [Gemmatimonadota bacterium]
MAERISKTQRWLDLIAFLIGHRFPVPVEQIMKNVPAYTADYESGDETRMASVRRKFERDKDELRDLGIPIETLEYSTNYGAEREEGYRLQRSNFYLPYLRIIGGETPGDAPPGGPRQEGAGTLDVPHDEMGTALNALSRAAALPSFPFVAEARSAFRKLTGNLDPGALEGRVTYAADDDAGVTRDRLRALAGALDRRKTVRFTYHGIHRGETTEREVHPWGLFFQGGSWYLTGHDVGRDAKRTFRVSRMEDPDVNHLAPGSPDFEVPDDFDVTAHTGRSAWELGPDEEEPVAARVHFAFPRSLWADRNAHGRLVEALDDGSAIREFEVRQVNPFLRWVLTLQGDARIVDPPALADELLVLARKVIEIHEAAAAEDADG